MSGQAIETLEVDETIQDEFEQETDQEIEQDSDQDAEQSETDEVEIVLEGEDEPASKPTVPLNKHLKRISKLNTRVETANHEAEEERQKREALEEQNRLLLMQINQGQDAPKGRPKVDDFESDAEYEAALEDYENTRISQVTQEKAAELLRQQAEEQARSAREAAFNSQLREHYERADQLKVSDYEETEDKAIDVMGKDIARQIMANTEQSQVVLYHLGKNPEKAAEYARKFEGNPIKGLLEIGGLASRLQVRSKSSLPPNPETQIEGGSVAGHESRYLKGVKFE